MMVRAITLIFIVFLAAACGGAPEVLDGASGDQWAANGKSDGAEIADHECRVILRRVTHGTVDAYSAATWVRFDGHFDVAQTVLDSGGRPGLMYRAGSESRWELAELKTAGGAPGGFQRFSFRLDAATLVPHDLVFERDTLLLLPFADTADGRLLDKNVIGDASWYELAKPDWAFSGTGVCGAPAQAASNTGSPTPALNSAGSVTVRVGEPNPDPCAKATSYAEALTVHNYQQTSQDIAAHACVLLPAKTGTADANDLRVHVRFDDSSEFVQSSVPFDRAVGSQARYRLDLWSLDPYSGPACPSDAAMEYVDGDYEMWARARFYFSTGTGEKDRAEIRPGADQTFQALYGAFVQHSCLH